ncbi:MAG TPA: CPBP family glutamic-type intramembrane protease [Phycisphaerales bacterium]|nr:CPBP family glutamic-type intramembrane protease [Phycisphaerales bacterium]
MGHAREQVSPRMQSGLSERYSPKGGYFHLSTRPLHVLCFLLPLIVLYEIGSAMYLSGRAPGAAETIRAYRLLSGFFTWFGVSGLYLPGVLLVVILAVWHVLTGDKTRVRLSVLGWMLIEAIAWTLPLLVLGQMIFRAMHHPAPPPAAEMMGGAGGPSILAAFAAGDPLASLSKPARATVAIGAGLYEELLFRMVAIALIHIVACDLLKMKDYPARVVAVVLSAVAFALYHDVGLAGGLGGIDFQKLVTFLFAGLYFGALYAARGFGIVVATHALYDLAVLVLLPG